MQYPGKINPGERYHHLVADKYAGKNEQGNVLWVFKCDCGNTVTKRAGDVKSGNTQSCGCFKLIVRKTHGMRKSREYHIWTGIKQRCYNKNELGYRHYGGRGIVMSDKWLHSFETFYADMGSCPSEDHSIERVDVNGNYCKENCTWATDAEQAANRRNTVKLRYKGREMLQAHIVKEMGINQGTFNTWLKRGLSPDEIDVYHNSGKWWYRNLIIPCVFKAAVFNGDFSKLISHGNFIVVSATDMGNGDILYKLIAKGKPEDYAYLLQS